MLLLLFTLLALAICVACRRLPFCGVGVKDSPLLDFNAERTLPLRGVLALLIVAHHLAQIAKMRGAPWPMTEFSPWGPMVVGMFLFITGYGLMVSYRRKGAAYLRGFIPHRLAKLLPPFLVATLVWRLLMKLQYGEGMLASFATLASGAGPMPNSWFVFAILLFYVFFYIVARLTPRPRRLIAALWLLSTLYIMALMALGFGCWWYSSVYALNVGFTYACAG